MDLPHHQLPEAQSPTDNTFSRPGWRSMDLERNGRAKRIPSTNEKLLLRFNKLPEDFREFQLKYPPNSLSELAHHI
jgi:hypothetical protein